MDNDKRAFLMPLLGGAIPFVTGLYGSTKAMKYITPKITRSAKRNLKRRVATGKTPSYLGKKTNDLLGWAGKKVNADNISSALGFTAGGAAGSIVASPFFTDNPSAEEQNMNKYSEHKLFGFLKAAMLAELSLEATTELTKQAFGDYDLKPEDIARIRMALQEEGVPAPYNDPYGAVNANYNENILKARDTSLDQIPEVEGSMSAVRKGAIGAGIGGVAGYGLGSALNSPNILGNGVPYGLKKRLPGAMGTSGVILGALLSALPAYKQKVDQVKGLQKLNYPENMQTLINSIDKDKALLSS